MDRVAARTEEGLALLTAGRGEDVERAVACFTAGAAAGEKEADRWLALLAASGVGMAQDWDRALDHLEQAAALGSQSARGQLSALTAAGDKVPTDLRAAADMASWLATPAKRVLNAQPRTVAIEGFVSAAVAEWIIGRAQSRLERAQLFQGETAAADRARTNSASQFGFADCDVVVIALRQKIANAIGVPVGALETSQVLHYATGQQFAAHFDWLDPMEPGQAQEIARAGQRIATFLVYLNDDFDGGSTAFSSFGLSHRGRRGDALYFANILPDGAPDSRTLHVGQPPTRGEKWVFSQWVRNQARG